MDNASSQNLIADRYALVEKTPLGYDAPQTESWVAHDIVLSRKLRAIIIDAQHPQRSAALDGARRAALFEDPQAVSIISIADTPTTAIFTEFPFGVCLARVLNALETAAKLTQSAQNVPVPSAANEASAASARDSFSAAAVNSGVVNAALSELERSENRAAFFHAVLGQFASVIANARHFGLRCLHLNAAEIYLTDADQILIDGLGVGAPLAGAALDLPSKDLDRSEARGLVVFLAALLSGRNFPANPAEHDAVVYQAREIAVQENYPQQIIDVLNAEINGQGSSSAGDFMRLLAPWDNSRISHFLHLLEAARVLSVENTVSAALAAADDRPDTALTAQEAAADISGIAAASQATSLNTAPTWPKLRDSNLTTELVADTASAQVINNVVENTLENEPEEEAGIVAQSSENSDVAAAAKLTDTNTPLSAPELADVTLPANANSTAKVNTAAEQVTADPRFHDGLSKETIGVATVSSPAAQAEAVAANTAQSAAYSKQQSDQKPRDAKAKFSFRKAKAARAEAAVQTTSDSESFAADSAPRSSEAREAAAFSQTQRDREKSQRFQKVQSFFAENFRTRFSVSQIAITFFLLLITLALIFGFWRLFQPLEDPSLNEAAQSTEQATDSENSAAKAQDQKKPAAPELKAAAALPVIENIELISSDPNLLDPTSPDVADLKSGLPRLSDGDPATGWSSWWFARPDVYNRGKLGLLVTLKEEAPLAELLIKSNSVGGKLQWKVIENGAAVAGANVPSLPTAAEAAFAPEISLKAAAAVPTKQFLLWIDEIPQTGNENRAELFDIQFK